MNQHHKAILKGVVTRSNVIGLRMAINADWRRRHGYSVSRTAPALRGGDLARTLHDLNSVQPRVVGPLAESGLKILRSPRYAKRLARVADVIADLRSFALIRFDGVDEGRAQPVYRAFDTRSRSFDFTVTPWQSGGDGPELV